jgi:hypothetical protein
MDPLRLCLAFGPLAVYLMLVGAINLMRRPIMVSGGRDLAALALALAGMVIIGPCALFLPEASHVVFGAVVWVLLLVLYILGVPMRAVSLRPGLVIYNMTADRLRPLLADMVERLDRDARWAGDSLVLPGLDVQLHLDSFPGMKNVSLKSIGSRQNILGWQKLEKELATALENERSTRNLHGLSLLLLGVTLSVLLILVVFAYPEFFLKSLAGFSESIMNFFESASK